MTGFEKEIYIGTTIILLPLFIFAVKVIMNKFIKSDNSDKETSE